jgi:hypothetical protein
MAIHAHFTLFWGVQPCSTMVNITYVLEDLVASFFKPEEFKASEKSAIFIHMTTVSYNKITSFRFCWKSLSMLAS